ncbi:hypothetical protein WDW89_10255 [Deltaproteobacteria bacterium TL4]
MYRLSITVPKDVANRFHEKVKRGERSQFISKAILTALEMQDRFEALEALNNFKTFKVEDDSVEVLRSIRNNSFKDLIRETEKK